MDGWRLKKKKENYIVSTGIDDIRPEHFLEPIFVGVVQECLTEPFYIWAYLRILQKDFADVNWAHGLGLFLFVLGQCRLDCLGGGGPWLGHDDAMLK